MAYKHTARAGKNRELTYTEKLTNLLEGGVMSPTPELVESIKSEAEMGKTLGELKILAQKRVASANDELLLEKLRLKNDPVFFQKIISQKKGWENVRECFRHGNAEFISVHLRQLGFEAEFLNKRHISLIAECLKHQYNTVEGHAIIALGKAGRKSLCHAGKIAPFLNNEDFVLRQLAVQALGRIGSLRHSTKIFTALKDREGAVRNAAAYALQGIKGKERQVRLGEAIETEDESWVKHSMHEVYFKISGKHYVPRKIKQESVN